MSFNYTSLRYNSLSFKRIQEYGSESLFMHSWEYCDKVYPCWYFTRSRTCPSEKLSPVCQPMNRMLQESRPDGRNWATKQSEKLCDRGPVSLLALRSPHRVVNNQNAKGKNTCSVLKHKGLTCFRL